MHVDAVEVVGPERAARAALVPIRAEHEMLDDELATPLEQVAERHFALRRVEDIALLDLLPRQLAALARQLVAPAGEFLLLGEMGLLRLQPLFVRNNARCRHDALLRRSPSLSNDSVQPRLWAARPCSSFKTAWVKTISVRSPTGLNWMVTMVSWPRGEAKSSFSCHAKLKTSRRGGSISRYLPGTVGRMPSRSGWDPGMSFSSPIKQQGPPAFEFMSHI